MFRNHLLRTTALFAPEDGGAGGGAAPAASAPSAPAAQHVVIEHRTAPSAPAEPKAPVTEAEPKPDPRDALIEELRAKQETVERKLRDQEQKTRDRLVRSEVKTAAVTAGARDTDDVLRMLDLAEFKLDDNGDVMGVTEAIAKLREAKPYLFAEPTTTQTQAAPKAADKPRVDAKVMTDAEFKVARARIRAGTYAA